MHDCVIPSPLWDYGLIITVWAITWLCLNDWTVQWYTANIFAEKMQSQSDRQRWETIHATWQDHGTLQECTCHLHYWRIHNNAIRNRNPKEDNTRTETFRPMEVQKFYLGPTESVKDSKPLDLAGYAIDNHIQDERHASGGLMMQ